MARHRFLHLKQNDMPMYEYISKFVNLVECAYGLSPTAQGSFILASTFIEGVMSPHVRDKLRSCTAQSFKRCILPGHPGGPETKVEGFGFRDSQG